jgi:RNA polymerase sigma-70 factor (ECF subfamily)
MAQVARSAGSIEYNPERGRFRDWLRTVTRHKLSNFLRSGRRGGKPKSVALDEDGDWSATDHTDPEWEAEFNAGLLRAALARVRLDFELNTWRAFEVTWLEGRPAAEAADETGLSVDAVYVAKSRVLRRLREDVVTLADDVPLALPSR